MNDPMFVTVLLAVIIGVLLSVFSHRISIPSVAPLLLAGLLFGPHFANLIRPASMGEGLFLLTRMGVAIILFDGGLSLHSEDFNTAPHLIRRLLTQGLLVSWLTIAIAIHLLFQFEPGASLLAASLVIVTGPTVIMPILRRIRIEEKLHNSLLWEGILIDPIGVFIATLCFELVAGRTSGLVAVSLFAARVAAGVVFGLAGGSLAVLALRRRWIPEELTNLFVLAIALSVFFGCEFTAHESGLLGALIAGFYIAYRRPPGLDDIQKFKSEISQLLIAVLFVLLSANLDLSRLSEFGFRGILLLLIVLFVARPLSILISAHGGHFSRRQKAFLSWVAPRGIVAASMASLFAQALRKEDPDLALFIELFTFSVIGVTVIIQGLTAGLIARLLGVSLPHPHRFVLIGGHTFARGIARYLDHHGMGPTLIVDSNRQNVEEAVHEGLLALVGDATNPRILDNEHATDIGYVLAVTDNDNVNALACQLWASVVGRDCVFRWAENVRLDEDRPGRIVWPGLPHPGILSSRLEHGVVQWRHFSGDESTADQTYWSEKTWLLALNNRRPVVDEDLALKDALLICHKAPELLRFIHSESCGELQAANRDELLRIMVEHLCLTHATIPCEKTVNELIEREKLFSTALGHGVAVPHSYTEGLEQPLVSFAVVRDGVDFGGDDGVPVRLVFMLLGPNNPSQHLNLLAEIARLTEDPLTRERLLQASSDDERLRLLSWSQIG